MPEGSVSAAGPGFAADRAGRLRILTFTTLYPNQAVPQHGIFVENRLRHLLAGGCVEARVVAPVPWFPLRSAVFGDYARFARAPAGERRHDIEILHPRYPVIPGIGMSAAPFLLYLWTLPVLRRLAAAGYDFDLIDAHYAYPDGVAAVALGRRLGKPVVVTARGSDINLLPQFAAPRRMIGWAARNSSAMIAVCQALKDRMVALGIAEDHVTVLRNGVDLARFRPVDRAAARRRYDAEGPTLLSVGHLIPLKGVDLTIRALVDLPGARLLLAGEGPEEAALRSLAERLGVAGRVAFLGQLAPDDLVGLYNAADVLVLASSREGLANVLLEAMACGTPVVASNISGTPEVVTCREAGILLDRRTPEAIAASVRALLDDPPARTATRHYAEQFNWDTTTAGQQALFRRILDARR
jgi:glycosyltransferase involved in cell wall biosynthesis